MERVQFADAKVALDISGSAGQAFRLYEAALNRTPDAPGLGFHMAGLDAGASLIQVAQGFINSPEFQQKYGAVDNAGYVNLLYQNVLGRLPDADGQAYHMGRLTAGISRSEVLVGFSESPENQAALMGIMEAGMVYA